MQKLKIFFLSLILILSLSTGVSAEYFSDIIITSPNGIWTDSRSYTTLNDAITAVGTNQRTIVIASPQTVTALTVPSTVTLKFERDGAIVNSGQLTINTKSIIADDHKIFAGLGDIDFAAGTELKLSWFHNLWNALTVTSDDHITLIINKAINATASCAVGNDVALRWDAPNIITANAGVTVSNIGQIGAGDYAILAGAGNFRFRDGAVLKLEWFPYLRTALTWIDTNKVTLTVNTSSAVDYSDSIPSNIMLIIGNGGELSISPGITLTIAAAKQIDIGTYYNDPFAGTGSVAITGGLTYTPATTLTAEVLQDLFLDTPVRDIVDTYMYEVDVLNDYGGGTSYTTTTIQSALTAIGTVNKTPILLRPGAWTVSVDADYSAYTNTEWNIPAGTSFNIANGVTLTLPKKPKAGLYKIFNCTGTGKVVFGSGDTDIPFAWFGTTPTNFASAVASVPLGGTLVMEDKAHSFSTGVTINRAINLKMIGDGYISFTGTDLTALTIDGVMYNTFDIAIVKSSINWAVGNHATDIDDAVNCVFNVKKIQGFMFGLYLNANETHAVAYNTFNLDWIVNNQVGVNIYSEATGWANDNIFYGGRFAASDASVKDLDRDGIRINGSAGNSSAHNIFYSPSFELEPYAGGIGVSNVLKVRTGAVSNHIVNGYAEGNTYVINEEGNAMLNSFNGLYGTTAIYNPSDYIYSAASTIRKGSNIINNEYFNLPKAGLKDVFSVSEVHRTALASVGGAGTSNAVSNFYINSLATGASSFSSTSLLVYKDYLSVGYDITLGKVIDTTVVKDFWLNAGHNATSTGIPIYVIRAFNSNQAALTGTSPYYITGETIWLGQDVEYVTETSDYGTAYTIPVSYMSTHIHVHDDVKFMFVGVGNAVSGKITALNHFSVMCDASLPTPFSYGYVRSFSTLHLSGPPAGCFFMSVGDQVWHSDATTGTPMGWQCIFRLNTTATAGEPAGEVNIVVGSIAGAASGDVINIELDNALIWHTTINGAPAGTTIVITDAIPVGRTVPAGALIRIIRTLAMANLT